MQNASVAAIGDHPIRLAIVAVELAMQLLGCKPVTFNSLSSFPGGSVVHKAGLN